MSGTKKNLLIVEDDAQLRILLTVILTQSGHSVQAAEDGFSALAILRDGMPDLILSDLYMLGMSGFELLSVVRRRFPALPVIAMSSAFSGGDIPTGVAADAFYQKATSIPTLLELVKKTEPPQLPQRSERDGEPAPIWIATHTSDDAADVILTCPECLRTSSHAPTPAAPSVTVIRSAVCAYCRTHIHYAMVQSVDPTMTSAIPRPAATPQRRPVTGTHG